MAFIIKYRTYEFIVMLFGLCNALATFQRLMDTVLRDILWHFIIVYIDNINVGSKSFSEYLKYLKQVFERLKKTGFKLNLKKYFFFKKELLFLEHVVSKEEIKTNPEKIAAIKNFPISGNVFQSRGFLELASYYGRFIRDFAKVVELLNYLLKKRTDYQWTNDQQVSFERLKKYLISTPILAYSDFEKPFIVYTDASTVAIGAILSQKNPEERERVIAYASYSLNKHERNYKIIKLECLAVIWAIKHYHHYLHGQKFLVITDHAALAYLKNMVNLVEGLGGWLMTLNGYNFEIINGSGKKHTNVDFLNSIEC